MSEPILDRKKFEVAFLTHHNLKDALEFTCGLLDIYEDCLDKTSQALMLSRWLFMFQFAMWMVWA